MAKILAVSEMYWPEGGGGVLATHLIVKTLKSLGFKVTVIHGSSKPDIINGVRYIYSDLLSARDKFRLWLNCVRLARDEWFLDLLEQHDVLYIPRYCYPLIPVAKRIGKRIVVHLHDYQLISYNANVPAPYEAYRDRLREWVLEVERTKGFKRYAVASLFWWVPRLAQKWLVDADAIICVSRRQAEIIANTAKSLRNKITIVYNPIPTEDFTCINKKLDDTPTFLYVGGDSHIKGFKLLLKAIEILQRERIKLRLRLAGDYSAKSLRELKKLSGGKIEIEIYGRVPYEKLKILHESLWGLLFPSITEEPLPYAVAESMASGTIPLASRVGGVPEIVEGTYAERFLFKPEDVEEFINRIEEVASMRRKDVLDVGARLREEVLRRFNMDKVKKQLLSIFGLV